MIRIPTRKGDPPPKLFNPGLPLPPSSNTDRKRNPFSGRPLLGGPDPSTLQVCFPVKTIQKGVSILSHTHVDSQTTLTTRNHPTLLVPQPSETPSSKTLRSTFKTHVSSGCHAFGHFAHLGNRETFADQAHPSKWYITPSPLMPGYCNPSLP